MQRSSTYDANLGLVEEIKILEDDGLKLEYKLMQFLSGGGEENRLFDFYEVWKIKLLHFSEKNSDRDFELAVKKADGISGFFPSIALKEDMYQGKTRGYYANEELTQVDPDEETIRQAQAMKNGISLRLEALSTFRKKVPVLESPHSKSIKVTLLSKEDVLEIGTIKISITKGSIERTLIEVLVKEKTEVSWDEIMNEYEPGSDYPHDKDDFMDLHAIKKLSDTKRRLNEKIISKTPLKEDLIKQRKNQYSLTRKVTKK